MADPNFKKISDMAEKTTVAATDFIPIVDTLEAADANKNKKITAANLRKDITTAEMLDGQVSEGKLANGAVTAVKIAADAVDSQHYAAGSIDLEHMSANSIDSDQYVDGSIDAVHVAGLDPTALTADKIVFWDDDPGALAYLTLGTGLGITGTTLNAASIGEGNIADGAVTSAKIADGTIANVDMAANSIDSDQYVDGSIDQEHLSVGASKVTNRQGGSATAWNTPGTTNYAIASAKIQTGSATTLTTGTLTVTFPVAFSDTPVLILMDSVVATGQYVQWGIANGVGFSVNVYNAAGNRIANAVNWIAIGAA